MKKFILFIAFLIAILSLNAQDIIIMRDASEVESKVLEIDETNVKYKKWDNPDGPTYTVQRDKILFIRYENGTKEVFNNLETPKTENKESVSDNHSIGRNFIPKPCFQGYIYTDYYVGKLMQGIDLNFNVGSRINDYVSVGFKSGFSFLFGVKQVLVPVHVDLRLYYPISKDIHPFIHISQGFEINTGSPLVEFNYINYDNTWNSDPVLATTIYIGYKGRLIYSGRIGIGCDIKAFSFSMGWYRFASYDNFYIGIGVNSSWRTRDE